MGPMRGDSDEALHILQIMNTLGSTQSKSIEPFNACCILR